MKEHDAEKRLWAEVEQVNKSFAADRLQLGKLFFQLKNLYSERANSGGGRLSSGHGEFEEQIKARGFKPRRVREWVVDYEVSEGLRPPTESTAARRKARRSNSAEYQRGFRAGLRSTVVEDDPVMRFAVLLPLTALKSAYRTALHELHPDHGGSEERTKELIAAWEEVERFHSSTDEVAADRVSVQ